MEERNWVAIGDHGAVFVDLNDDGTVFVKTVSPDGDEDTINITQGEMSALAKWWEALNK